MTWFLFLGVDWLQNVKVGEELSTKDMSGLMIAIS
jgi:hypothetical protein